MAGDGEDEANWRRGMLTRIKLRNFMSYNRVEFSLEPKVNLLVGPNGSGKSSVVCAVCLGLGGAPALLGRAKKPASFIKHGTYNTKIEIELYESKVDQNGYKLPNPVICRKISKPKPRQQAASDSESEDDNGQSERKAGGRGGAFGRGKSEWRINGKKQSEAIVKKLISDFHIQLNNLCQFLPQDKVQEFSQMNPRSLLVETQRALVGDSLVERQQQLSALQTELREAERVGGHTRERLLAEEAENERLEREVNLMRERQQLVQKLELARMKRAWVEFDELREQFRHKKAVADAASKALKEVKAKMAPLSRSINRGQARVEEAGVERAQAQTAVNTQNRECEDLKAVVERLVDEHRDISAEIRGMEAERARLQQKLERERGKLDVAVAGLREIEEREGGSEARKVELAASIREMKREQAELRTTVRESELTLRPIQQRIQEINDERQRLNNVQHRKFAAVSHAAPHVRRAYDWLQNNRHQFSGRVYGPISMEINVACPLHARYVEHHMPSWLFHAFVTENKGDYVKLLAELKDRQHLKVSATNGGDDAGPVRPASALEHLRYLGINTTLDKLVEANPVVMKALCIQAGFGGVFIGDDSTEAGLVREQDVFKKLGASILFTPINFYKVVVSRYGARNASVTNDPLKPLSQVRVLSLQVDSARLETLAAAQREQQQRLEEASSAKQQAATRLQQLSQQLQQATEEHRALLSLARDRRNAAARVAAHRRSIAGLERELATDVSGRVQALTQQLRGVSQQRLTATDDVANCVALVSSLQLRLTFALMEEEEARSAVRALQDQLRQFDAEKAAAAEEKKRATAEAKAAKRGAKECHHAAQALTGPITVCSSSGSPECSCPDTSGALKDCPQQRHSEQWELVKEQQFPESVEELDIVVHEMKARVEAVEHNPGLVEEYERRQQQIEELRQRLATHASDTQARADEMETLKTQWLETVSHIVGKTNIAFGEQFKRLNCSGEVRLNTTAPSFSEYGVEIWVSYRKTQKLQPLDATVQSGGERSVATILYLLALQGGQNCPFRLVDEINQGMDAVNERLSFGAIVDASRRQSAHSASQFFLITPKLLPDLDYSEEVNVIFVCNGTAMLSHKRWDLDRCLERSFALSQLSLSQAATPARRDPWKRRREGSVSVRKRIRLSLSQQP